MSPACGVKTKHEELQDYGVNVNYGLVSASSFFCSYFDPKHCDVMVRQVVEQVVFMYTECNETRTAVCPYARLTVLSLITILVMYFSTFLCSSHVGASCMNVLPYYLNHVTLI